jgi:hypothetical protein
MTTRQQDNTARRFDPNLFDCELPPNARAEFFSPQRPRVLVPPESPKKPSAGNPRRSFGLWAWLAFALVCVALANWKRPTAATTAQSPSTTQVQSTPTPALVSTPAPRAELVPVPVRRGILYRLPWQEIGVYKWYELPAAWGGGSVWARYLGTKEYFSQIPPNPTPGDLWNVIEGNASWIYCQPLNYNHPIWIDP